jgi:hypothetical protein
MRMISSLPDGSGVGGLWIVKVQVCALGGLRLLHAQERQALRVLFGNFDHFPGVVNTERERDERIKDNK